MFIVSAMFSAVITPDQTLHMKVLPPGLHWKTELIKAVWIKPLAQGSSILIRLGLNFLFMYADTSFLTL